MNQISDKLKNVLRPELDKAGFDYDYAAKEISLENESLAGAIMIANEKFQQLFPH